MKYLLTALYAYTVLLSFNIWTGRLNSTSFFWFALPLGILLIALGGLKMYEDQGND